ncbi:MAG TPA: M1 family metallopeptidase [Pirellulaceae bacterium]|nr:M1 family metallopeptidase [Pirellulaceae bacterium]HMO92210.1 M1 family metallopeptidase [Pirellulaceae bacterium]HMP68863.1 M1 family metallopeptidase [Pirellulaceae bacterium]
MRYKKNKNCQFRLVVTTSFLQAIILASMLVGVSTTWLKGQEAADEADQEQAPSLQFRPMSARADKTIFSPLNLPTPNRIRTASGMPGPDYWQQQADYKMEVELDTENESVNAVATITYTNNSPDALHFLWLSLEQNLFKEDSLGSLTTPAGARFNNRQRFVGGYKIKYVRMGDEELTLSIYDTLGRIELPEPVAPKGGQVSFEIAWSFDIPDYGVDRMGIRRVRAGKIFQIAQWFPHLCKYDDVHGWNTLPYLGQGEFYSEFGTYDVRITAPRGHVVLATGELLNPHEVLTPKQLTQLSFAKGSRQTITIRGAEEIGTDEAAPAGEGPLTWHFNASQVRSFAWTSSDATIWDAASITWDDGQTVLVQSVYPQEARGAWVESTQMLRHSILHYSDQWFRYPYPTAINVNGSVGGMEYPMIIFCGGDRNRRGLFGVTSHEIGHTWFPMVVNTDERRHPWMDEGFNTFINFYDRLEDFDEQHNDGDPADEMRPVSLRQYARFNANPAYAPIALPADHIEPNMLGQLAYYKPGLGLRFLREVVVGPKRFDAAFRHYIASWAFKSPQPADFFRCMENGTGMNLDWFWRGWLFENLEFDQAMHDVQLDQRRDAARISVGNLKEMVMPVFLSLEFDDGSEQEITLPVQVWHYTNRWTFSVPLDGKSLRKVTLDPNRILPDSNRRNNEWAASVDQVETESEVQTETEAATDR